jgi:hypothetical protein
LACKERLSTSTRVLNPLRPSTQVGLVLFLLPYVHTVRLSYAHHKFYHTGTTLIGGPTAAVTEIYSKISGSQPLSGQMSGYFSIPCSTSVSTSFTFGSKTWSIDPADFNVQQLDGRNCLGAFFGLDLGSQGGPDWVIGDSFLKNVYSVFRFTPPSVGFAQLAGNLQGCFLFISSRHFSPPLPALDCGIN